jgi:uncharacterized protein
MPIRYLILSLTTRCNLQCRYCYNDTPKPITDMPKAVIKDALSLVSTQKEPFHLQLTGGEPTLLPDLIKTAAKLAANTRQCHSIGIQTNGTCLTLDLLKIFKRHQFQIGISLDGPPSIHQLQRGMAAETLRGLQLLESAQLPFQVTTVVTQVNAACLDQLVLTLAGFNSARGIGLDLLIDKGRARNSDCVGPADKSTLQRGLQRMLTTLDLVNARRTIPLRLRERDLILAANKKGSAFCHACRSESMAVTPSGQIFPCGQTVNDSRFAAGTIWEPKFERLHLLHEFMPNTKQCDDCSLQNTCPGDCPSRLYYNKKQQPPQVCNLYQCLWQFKNDQKKN